MLDACGIADAAGVCMLVFRWPRWLGCPVLFLCSLALCCNVSMKTAKQQNSKTAKQQNSKTAKQQNSNLFTGQPPFIIQQLAIIFKLPLQSR